MKNVLKLLPILILLVACNQGRDDGNQDPVSTGPPEPEMRYLGQSPPGTKTEFFAPGIVSTDAVELNSVFSPDGREFFFTRLIDGPDETEHEQIGTEGIGLHLGLDDRDQAVDGLAQIDRLAVEVDAHRP